MAVELSPADLERLADLVADRLDKKLAARPRLVDRIELARQLGIGPATVERRVADGSIPSIRCGRRILFDPAAVVTALANASDKNAQRPTADEATGR